MTSSGRIGPAGAVARAVTGTALIAAASNRCDARGAVTGLVAAPAVVLAGVSVWRAAGGGPIRVTGVVGHAGNLAAITTFGVAAPCAAGLFYGSSLLLAAARRYAACEMFAISNLLLRRNDELGCPVFFPVDFLERR